MHIYTLADIIPSSAVRSPGQASCILGRPLDGVIQHEKLHGPSSLRVGLILMDSPSGTRSMHAYIYMRMALRLRASIQTNTAAGGSRPYLQWSSADHEILHSVIRTHSSYYLRSITSFLKHNIF
jgi:hypothetical protein